MTYSHTFEIDTDSQAIEGEIHFDENGDVIYKTSVSLDGVTLKTANSIVGLFQAFANLYDAFGGLTKVEINRKV